MTVTTEHFYSGNNSTTSFAYTFPYYKTSDIKVKVGGTLKTESTHYNITGTNVVFTSGNTPPNGTNNIHIYRETDVDTSKATFAAGSSIRATDLNNNETQLLYHAQEQNFNKIQTADVEDGAITSAKILDGTIATADIADNAVTSAKLATNSIDATNLAANSVGASELADNAVDTAALADDAVTSAKIATGAVIADSIGTNAVTTAKIYNDAVETAKINDGAVTTAKINNSAVTAGKIATDAVTTAKILDANVTTNKIANDSVTSDKISNNAVITAKIPDNAVTTAKLADAELTTLASMQSGTASILASGTALTSTTAELNLLDGKSVVTAVSGSSNDNQLPTAKAVNDQIVSLLNDAGGFVPIANEVSFPNANPDPNDGAGTIVSIADAGGVVVNASGVSTTGRTLGGATVTINGIDSSLNSSTIAAGKGMLVQTTSTLNTYTYHRLVVDEAGVATAQTLVSDFNERYRVGSSNPTSSLDDGDLFFNTTSDKMLVYNATASAWEEVQSVGNFFIATFSESFDGSRTDFTISNAPTNAQQILLSINGVVQKPNAGTSTPSEGFALSSNTVKLSTAPASGSDYFAVVIGATVNIGAPTDNTVSTIKIQNAAVTNDKIANDTISEAKLDIHAAPSGTDKFLKYTSNGMEWVVPSYTTNTDTNTQLTEEQVEDFVGGMVTGNTETGITVTYEDSDGTLDFVVASQTDENFTTADHDKLDGIAASANNYTHPNHSGEVTSTADGATVIADNVVDEANLKVSNAPTNGYVLTAQSGNTGGMTWELAAAGATGGNSNSNGVFWENQQTVTHDYTIQNNYNAGSFGPITINSGITVTVGAGESWTVI